MYIKQLYTNCLAQAAYYIESDGEAIVIDPLREPEPYLHLAKERNAKIKYVFETHFHADFVSGHLDLSHKTGAVIVYGPSAKPAYQALTAIDGEKFKVGKLKIEVLHTPGHTLESSCFLLYDELDKPHCIFTGDTLFVGDVGRPDLLSGNLSKEELAGMLFDSLNKKIKNLPDHLIVYPGHGPGSACGKNIGKETVSTIGEQKINNYALQNISRETFIKKVTEGLGLPPAYFFKDAHININGYDKYEELMRREAIGLSISDFNNEILNGALILDTRTAEEFGKDFIPGSINIGLNGEFAVWAGTLLEFNKPLVIVASTGAEKESITRLARIGYDNVKGFLKDGIETWKNSGLEMDSVTSIEYSQLDIFTSGKNFVFIDVRKPGENEHLKLNASLRIPLNTLGEIINGLDKTRPYLLYCAGGYRSMIAVSLLKRNGIKNVLNLKGGINAYSEVLQSKK